MPTLGRLEVPTPLIVGLCIGLSFSTGFFVGKERGYKEGVETAVEQAERAVDVQQTMAAFYLLCLEAWYEIPVIPSLNEVKKAVGTPEALEGIKEKFKTFKKLKVEVEAAP